MVSQVTIVLAYQISTFYGFSVLSGQPRWRTLTHCNKFTMWLWTWTFCFTMFIASYLNHVWSMYTYSFRYRIWTFSFLNPVLIYKLHTMQVTFVSILGFL